MYVCVCVFVYVVVHVYVMFMVVFLCLFCSCESWESTRASLWAPVSIVLTVPLCPQCSLGGGSAGSLCYRPRAHSSYLSYVVLCLCLKPIVVQQAVVLRALQEATFNIRMLLETLAGFIILLCLA